MTTTAADPGLCLSSTVLGREGKSTNTGHLLLFGDECNRAKVVSRGHVVFSKWNVLCSLEDAIPEARSQNTEALPEDAITLPTTTDVEIQGTPS